MIDNETPNQLMTVNDLAELLQIPVRTIRDWRLDKQGPPAMKLGAHVRWRRSVVDAWLDEMAAKDQAAS